MEEEIPLLISVLWDLHEFSYGTRLPTLVSWIHNAGTDNISKEEEKYSSQEKHQETSEDDQ